MLKKLLSAYANFVRGLNFLAPLVDLLIRLYVANVFWKSGLTKIASWPSTLALFAYEYSVPFLPPEVAAVIGTGIELAMPVLLVLGLAGRVSALVLFLFNIMAVVSYPELTDLARQHHYYWGMLLAFLVVHGCGRLAVDHFLCRKAPWSFQTR
ncbi:MAG: DoxX family protein [Thiobacillaceae bacterium]